MGVDNNVRMSVWVLSEFVFCQRAGLIAHRSKLDGEAAFQEDDDSYGRLDFLPDFDGAEIERAIADTRRRIVRVVVAAVWTALAAYILGDQVWRGFWWIGLAVLIPGPNWLMKMVRRLNELREYARQFRDRVPNEPALGLNRPTEFNWWDFHTAGFRVVKPRQRYHDPELNLDGCPWRVLERGSVRIPVFRKHKGELSAGPSQFATLAAYSHLIRVCEGAESPYGVILFPDSWTVLVVPDGCGAESFRSAFVPFRDMLDADDRGHPPGPPASLSPCKGCPHGMPKPLVTENPATWEPVIEDWNRDIDVKPPPERRPTIHVVGAETIRPHVVYGVDGWRYHSLCGDLFSWIPPHKNANGLALETTPYPEPPDPDDEFRTTVPEQTVRVVVQVEAPQLPPPPVQVIYVQGQPPVARPTTLPSPPTLPPAKTDGKRPSPPPQPPTRAPDGEEEFGAGIL